MRQKLEMFIDRIQAIDCQFINMDFRNLEVEKLESNVFVYADPPYLITNASYNESGGWDKSMEIALLDLLDRLDQRGIRFALSNVIESKGRRNELLMNWTIHNKNRYKVHYLNHHYSNSNYQTKNRNRDATVEVLITNYES
jgi:site-specific DNA-adenine methylase